MNDKLRVFIFFSAMALISAGCSSAPVEPVSENGTVAPGSSPAETAGKRGYGNKESGKGPSASAKIIFVRQRCFVIETADHVIIFDPPEFKTRELGRKTFSNGFVNTGIYRNSNVTVFITASKYDRFYPDIWDWNESIGELNFVVAPGVSDRDARFKGDKIAAMKPGEVREFTGMIIAAVPVKGGGQAYFIEADGVDILYCGEFGFPAEGLEPLLGEGTEIDIAVQAFNRRGGEAGYAGLLRLAKERSPKLLIPIEPGGRIDNETISRFAGEVETEAPGVRVWNYGKKGESFRYPADLDAPQESE